MLDFQLQKKRKGVGVSRALTKVNQYLFLYLLLLILYVVSGWGSSARQKLYFGPLGYESGSSPIQRATSFERSYNYGLRFEVGQ